MRDETKHIILMILIFASVAMFVAGLMFACWYADQKMADTENLKATAVSSADTFSGNHAVVPDVEGAIWVDGSAGSGVTANVVVIHRDTSKNL